MFTHLFRSIMVTIRFPAMLLLTAFFTTWVLLLIPFPYKIRIFFGKRLLSYWAKTCCWLYFIRITVVGKKPKVRAGTLVVSNHIGYWDVIILGSLFPTVFLSKAEVKSMPIVGQGAWAAGVLFVDRSSATSGAKSIRNIAKGITQGATIIAFPEGTTTKIPEIRDFKLGTFKSAVLADIPIQPVGFTMTEFAEEGWHDEPMMAHYYKRGGKLSHHAFVAFGELIRAEGDDPAHARDVTKKAVEEAFARANAAKIAKYPHKA
ncbi:MAG: 1-acyl-sn-glycerol-3-phosphate acyltransferase [Leptospiraceae bacterium]|nr:1-acyl-sn-glycerol-3-phosphate acyltransferase [Leptospiraceae bacterium]